MDNQSTKSPETVREYAIDRLHQLAEIGDYVSACSVYEEFRDIILNAHEFPIIYKS
jgi:hypothetical protein